MVALDMEGLVQRSDLIAVVRVIDQQARWGPEGRILTDVLLEVEQSSDVGAGPCRHLAALHLAVQPLVQLLFLAEVEVEGVDDAVLGLGDVSLFLQSVDVGFQNLGTLVMGQGRRAGQ